MQRISTSIAFLVAAGLAAAACGPATPREASSPDPRTSRRDTAYVRPLFGPTWTLVRLRGAPAPTGAQGRPATLIFYSGAERTAAGFSGCNRWTSQYTLAGRDSIAFTPPVSTRMACQDGMQLESAFLGLIERASRIARRDSTLILATPRGDTAVFVAREE